MQLEVTREQLVTRAQVERVMGGDGPVNLKAPQCLSRHCQWHWRVCRGTLLGSRRLGRRTWTQMRVKPEGDPRHPPGPGLL